MFYQIVGNELGGWLERLDLEPFQDYESIIVTSRKIMCFLEKKFKFLALQKYR